MRGLRFRIGRRQDLVRRPVAIRAPCPAGAARPDCFRVQAVVPRGDTVRMAGRTFDGLWRGVVRISGDLGVAVRTVERSVDGSAELLRVGVNADRATATDVFGELGIVVAGQAVRIGRLRPCRECGGEREDGGNDERSQETPSQMSQ